MEAYEISNLINVQQEHLKPYYEFLRHPSLSMGLYVLSEGGVDRQKPHTEDEVYYVISGRGVINVAGEDRAVKSGSIVYIGAKVEHFFHLITEKLVILVLFAPAAGTAKKS